MNFAVLRLLDASANRAREALRVLEDYARFILNDPQLSAELKQSRHTFAAACAPFLSGAMIHRDTLSDVGTTIKTPAELHREDLPAVITAAGKRLGEALRSLEEYTKIEHPGSSATLEQLRYQFYTIEQRLARTLRPAKRFEQVRLCILITESSCRRPWLETAEQAILGGADCLQLREKEMESGELLRRAKDFVKLCRQHHVVSIINDRPDIAVLSDAHGVHVGQGDLPAVEVRKMVGNDLIVGVSTHEMTHARQAVLNGADYIGVGPVFRSGTKPRDILPGLSYARQVAQEIRIPALAIAGITEANADEVLATGVRGIAVTAAVAGCDDVAGATRRFKQKLQKTG